ncbi:uncharacterized protein LOC102802352 [Saccoglossus kowalevskii]
MWNEESQLFVPQNNFPTDSASQSDWFQFDGDNYLVFSGTVGNAKVYRLDPAVLTFIEHSTVPNTTPSLTVDTYLYDCKLYMVTSKPTQFSIPVIYEWGPSGFQPIQSSLAPNLGHIRVFEINNHPFLFRSCMLGDSKLYKPSINGLVEVDTLPASSVLPESHSIVKREQLDCLFPSPCENGGVCEDTLMGYVCQCPEDFTGTNCETEIQHTCQSDAECQNGGTCDITNDQCHCQPNYDGETCEIELCAAPANDVTGFEFLDLQASFPSDTEWNLANDPAIASFSIGTDTFIVVYEVLEDFVSVGSFSPTPPTFQVLKTISFPGEFITHVEPFVMSGLQYVAIGLTARSVFYRWDGTDLVDEKDISANEGAEHLHFFSSGHGHFIVRSYSPQLSISSNSVIHRWDESSGEFVHHQDILTRDAKMSTTFSDDTSTYLFFASDSLNPLLEPRMLVQNDVNPNFSPLIINGINSASIDAVLTLKFGCQRYLVTEVASITKPEIYRWDNETGDFTTVAIPLTQTFYLINPAAFTYFEVGDAYPHFIHMGMSATPGFLRSLFVIKPSFGQVDLFEIIQYIDATPYPPLVSHAFKHDSEVYLLYSTSVDRHLMKWGPTP